MMLRTIGYAFIGASLALLGYLLGRRTERRSISARALEMRQRRMAEEAADIEALIVQMSDEWQQVRFVEDGDVVVASWKGPALNSYGGVG